MTEQDIATESGAPEPGPDNFDFEAWLEGESTFPEFKHTAYLDQRSGAELARVLEELEEVAQEVTGLEKRIEIRNQQSASAFVDTELDGLVERRDALGMRVKELEAWRDQLQDQIFKSAVTLTFQVKTPEELGTVTRDATREFYKEHPKFKGVKEDDLDHITARTRFMLAAQIAHFCSGMVLHRDNRKVPPPTRKGANAFLGKLISSELMRLMESVGTGLSASQEWANKLDAGFPGGSPDVENVSLDQDGAERGEVLGSAAADDADRAPVGLG
jgi:hypothetical protein